jgi:hypothetical protein
MLPGVAEWWITIPRGSGGGAGAGDGREGGSAARHVISTAGPPSVKPAIAKAIHQNLRFTLLYPLLIIADSFPV